MPCERIHRAERTRPGISFASDYGLCHGVEELAHPGQFFTKSTTMDRMKVPIMAVAMRRILRLTGGSADMFRQRHQVVAATRIRPAVSGGGAHTRPSDGICRRYRRAFRRHYDQGVQKLVLRALCGVID